MALEKLVTYFEMLVEGFNNDLSNVAPEFLSNINVSIAEGILYVVSFVSVSSSATAASESAFAYSDGLFEPPQLAKTISVINNDPFKIYFFIFSIIFELLLLTNLIILLQYVIVFVH